MSTKSYRVFICPQSRGHPHGTMSTTTTSNHVRSEDRLVEAMATSLSENLIYYYPDGKYDERQVKLWLEECVAYIRRHTTSEQQQQQQQQREQRLVKQGFTQALLLSKQGSIFPMAPAGGRQNPAPSFSLLDALTSSGGLASIVGWEQVQQAETAQDKLKRLLTIEYMDDVLPDWNDFRVCLLQGLRETNDTTTAAGYLQLHKRWFGRTRSLLDYQSIQIDLCQNVVTVMVEKQQSAETISETDPTAPLLGLFHVMWMDWMLRGLYVQDDRVWEIGRTAWNCMQNLNILEQMMTVDPYAHWFYSWMAHFPPQRILELVAAAEDDSFLPSWIDRCQRQLLGKTAPVDLAFCNYALSILRTILVGTRVALFPWHTLSPALTTSESVETLFDLFLDTTTIEADKEMIVLCDDALETLLYGSREDTVLVERLVQKLTSSHDGLQRVQCHLSARESSETNM
jgi:hypothetical protein